MSAQRSARHGAGVVIDSVSKTYAARDGAEIEALSPTSLTIAPGEFVAVVGPSGCGKSTLLSLIAGLATPSAGRVLIDGEPVLEPHPKVGVVFQSDLLLYWRTVADNILLPVEIKRWPRSEYIPRMTALLEQVGLGEFAAKYPGELSGGMRQRAAICRALIQQPGLLLMDEPFGALDNTVLFITHSIDEAIFLADRVLVMSPRPGRIVLDLAVGLERPRKWRVHKEPRFQERVAQVRAIFEAAGVLAEHE